MEKVKGKKVNIRHSADDLLDAGLNLLAAESIARLTIDGLCKRLGVTKGSFYHHFKNRADYLERMLEHWVQVWTIGRMKEFESNGSAQERYKKMIDVAVNYSMDVEISIRAWAQRDSLARKYLQKVDSIRMDYLCSIFEEICGDSKRAKLLSKIDYMLFVGSRMISPPIMGEEGREIINLLLDEVYNIPAD
ncbi:TetR/AcrR family transcriptional regulator [Maridesulfovibrio hydrothermalis]|uniref:Transcriptional regulator, TetR family n=1 Tax=Maridesulfovibrio hydrothermalis AM13 = DSM 14728 TaxID=1121451 RepID=L0RDL0_9BACT|nr:TetR/AcrR family transcriptional regulator [Maridesulfovibrio hydrothermalis]CCO24853.1 Transcriptional regulator, TetR family [Maridesulfovibrio hydrothermalis AM13 = DSM 14728]